MCRLTLLIQLAVVALSFVYTNTQMNLQEFGPNDDYETKSYQVDSILFGPNCFWFRLLFLFNPLYFCPPPTVVQYNVTSNGTGGGLTNKFGDDDEIFTSPIDLTPAKPRRKPNRVQPPADHRLTSDVIANSPIDLTPAKPNREQSQTQPPPQRSTTSKPPWVPNTTEMPKSKCGLAIIRCCKLDYKILDEECFEQMGCPGPFWDYNPCKI